MPQHILVYSHGFGVRKDDRGLFTEIAASLPDATHIMFDYNHADEATGSLTVAPLTEQVAKLRSKIEQARADSPNAIIDLVCHSQGCVVAALLAPQGIRKAILIAPPAELSIDQMLQIFTKRPGSHIDLQGTSHLARADFTTTDVPATYWKSIEGINPIALYNAMSTASSLTVINAAKDEILGNQDFSTLSPDIHVTALDTGHNFDDMRTQLTNLIAAGLTAKPRIIIVNENDEIIGHKERGTMQKEDIYRVSSLWVTNSNGDVLLAQRKFTKKHDPGKWGPAVAGTVDEGETYDSNIIKEAEEEIGLHNIQPVLGPKRRIRDEYNYFCQLYTLVVNKPAADFVIQEDEVEQVRWFTREEFEKGLREHPEQFLDMRWALESL